MPNNGKFGLFIQDKNGPLWKAFFDNLDEAKLHAQDLADREGLEVFHIRVPPVL